MYRAESNYPTRLTKFGLFLVHVNAAIDIQLLDGGFSAVNNGWKWMGWGQGLGYSLGFVGAGD